MAIEQFIILIAAVMLIVRAFVNISRVDIGWLALGLIACTFVLDL